MALGRPVLPLIGSLPRFLSKSLSVRHVLPLIGSLPRFLSKSLSVRHVLPLIGSLPRFLSKMSVGHLRVLIGILYELCWTLLLETVSRKIGENYGYFKKENNEQKIKPTVFQKYRR